VKVDCGRPRNAVGSFGFSSSDIQSNGFPKLRVKHAASSPGVDDGFESLGARRVLGRERNVDWYGSKVRNLPSCVGKLLVRNSYAHNENGAQVLGVLIRTGSDTPASSLFVTTSSYVEPTAMSALSSSESAIQLSGGALRSALKRGSWFATGIFYLSRGDVISYFESTARSICADRYCFPAPSCASRTLAASSLVCVDANKSPSTSADTLRFHSSTARSQ
jgi:hypothetical protein